jgi:hypothetical protein
MFNDSPVMLVQDIRCDILKNVSAFQLFPEWVYNRLDHHILTVLLISRVSLSNCLQYCEYLFQVTRRMCFVLTEAVGWNSALWTGSVLAICAEKLLGVTTDKACKEGVTTVDIVIAKAHLNTVHSGYFEWLSNFAHT